MGFTEVAEFADAALHQPACRSAPAALRPPQPGEERQYIRFAYSGISVDDIREGIGSLREWISAA